MTTKTVTLPAGEMSDLHEHTSGCGRLNLLMTLGQALGASHWGQCEADVTALMAHPDIAQQLAAIDADMLRDELRGSGAWGDDELTDVAQNLRRFVWLAACEIREEPEYTRIC